MVRKHEEPIGSDELQEPDAHEELSKIMTVLNRQQTRSGAERSVVPLATGEGLPQLLLFTPTTVDAVVTQEMPNIFRRWMFLTSEIYHGQQAHQERHYHGDYHKVNSKKMMMKKKNRMSLMPRTKACWMWAKKTTSTTTTWNRETFRLHKREIN